MRHWKLGVVILVAVVIAFLIPQPARVSNISSIGGLKGSGCVDDSKRECTTPQGYVGYRVCSAGVYSQECFISNVDECILASNETYKICCKTTTGKMYDCTNNKNFQPGDYIIVKTDIQKSIRESTLNLDVYKACGFSKLEDAPSEVPMHYQSETVFSDTDAGVGCSPAFSSDKFHQGVIDGFIPNTPGKVRIVEWRVYPTNLDLSSAEKAVISMIKSVSIFNIEVNIGA